MKKNGLFKLMYLFLIITFITSINDVFAINVTAEEVPLDSIVVGKYILLSTDEIYQTEENLGRFYEYLDGDVSGSDNRTILYAANSFGDETSISKIFLYYKLDTWYDLVDNSLAGSINDSTVFDIWYVNGVCIDAGCGDADKYVLNFTDNRFNFSIPSIYVSIYGNDGKTLRSKIGSLNIPSVEKAGFRLTGWKLSRDNRVYTADGISQIGLDPANDSNFTFDFEAQWEAIDYKITYSANGGTGTPPSNTTCNFDYANALMNFKNGNNPCKFAQNTGLTRAGYHFKGWSTSQNGSGIVYLPDQTVTVLFGADTNITLYAVWEEDSYNIIYDSKVIGTYNYSTSNQTVTVALPTKVGHTLASLSSGSDATTNTTTGVVTIKANTKGNITLTAGWNENTITFKNGNTTVGTCKYTRTDCSLTAPTTNIPVGKRFNGWIYNNKTEIPNSNFEAKIFGDETTVSLTPRYESVRYNITYNLNDGDNNFKAKLPGNSASSYSIDDFSGNTYTLNLNVPTREGHTFTGWNTNLGQVYDASGVYTLRISNSTSLSNVTLTAQWSMNKYKIQYKSNGTNCYRDNTNHNYGDSVTIANYSSCGTVPTNKKFAGWIGSDGSFYDEGAAAIVKYSGTGDYVLTALIVDKDHYTITYNLDGGSFDGASATVYSKGVTIPLTIPHKTNYVFKGWYTNLSDNSTRIVDTANREANLTVYAKWQEVSYTIKYHEGSMTDGSCTYSATSCTLANSTTSTGWSLRNGGSLSYRSEERVTGEELSAIANANNEIHLYPAVLPTSKVYILSDNGGIHYDRFVTYTKPADLLSCVGNNCTINISTAIESNARFMGYRFIDTTDGTLITANDVKNFSGNQTIVAVYQNSITWNTNGGSWPSGYTPPSMYTDINSLGLKGDCTGSNCIQEPTNGVLTLGWTIRTSEQTNGVNITDSLDLSLFQGHDVIIEATWSPGQIIYDLDGGTWPEGHTSITDYDELSDVYDNGSLTFTDPENSDDKKLFSGWTIKDSKGVEITNYSNIKGDILVSANWDVYTMKSSSSTDWRGNIRYKFTLYKNDVALNGLTYTYSINGNTYNSVGNGIDSSSWDDEDLTVKVTYNAHEFIFDKDNISS